MKINCIINETDLDSKTDVHIFSFLLKKIKDNVKINMVNVSNFKCDKASINIYFNCINGCLLDYAKSNILIPSQHTFLTEWSGHLSNFNLILAKTHYIETILNSFIDKDKIKYIGWRSTDLNNNYDKDYSEWLLCAHDAKYTDYNKIITNWDESFPTLNILNIKPIKQQKNINYLNQLSQNDFENLVNKCGIHLCLSMTDGFSHQINQCCLVKSIPV